MAAVSTRYAEALLDSEKDKDKACKYLESIARLYDSNNEFRETFNNPRISREDKMEIIKEIIKSKDDTFINFINLVLKEGRFNLIFDIYNKYQAMLDELNRKINIKIISSCELTKKEIDGIKEKYKKLYKASDVSYEVSVDESLIGGVKVICAGKIYDDTIKTKLEEML